MGLRFPSQKHGSYFFITTTFKDWRKLGSVPGFLDDLAESLQFVISKYAASAIAYVFMPSHLHLIVYIDGNQLGDMIRDFKKFTAQKVAAEKGIDGGIWMPRYDRVMITSEALMRTKINYIHNNPLKAGLVKSSADWRWSSASDYLLDRTGLLPTWKSWA
jgi:REP element-mobilizing transposase RayT